MSLTTRSIDLAVGDLRVAAATARVADAGSQDEVDRAINQLFNERPMASVVSAARKRMPVMTGKHAFTVMTNIRADDRGC